MTVFVDAVFPRRVSTAALLASLTLAGCAPTTTRVQAPAPTAAPAAGAPAQAPSAQATPAAPAAPKAPEARVATSPDGTKIEYDVTGSGPMLLLLSGPGQLRQAWRDRGYVERLAKKFTVITADPRGAGGSGRPLDPDAYALDRMLEDAIAVADAAGAARFHVWGFGHGAAVARYLAARSDRVISAVLVSTNMGPALDGMVKEAVAGMRASWLPVVQGRAAGTLDLKTLSAGDQDAWQRGTPITAVAIGAMLDYPPLEPADIKAPTLWLVGSADTSGLENAKAYESKLAGTKVTLKILGQVTFADSFGKSELVVPEVEPFLAAATGS